MAKLDSHKVPLNGKFQKSDGIIGKLALIAVLDRQQNRQQNTQDDNTVTLQRT